LRWGIAAIRGKLEKKFRLKDGGGLAMLLIQKGISK
jgi:hypothetical protein